MTLDDARREVLRWALPVNEAWVDRAMYAMVADVAQTFPRDRGGSEWGDGWTLFDQPYDRERELITRVGTVVDPQAYGTEQALDPNRVLILLDASQRGVDLMLRGGDAVVVAEESPSYCFAVSSRSRTRFVSVFDASTGRYLGSDFITDAWLPDWLDVLAALPEPEVVLVATATPTASATSTATAHDYQTPTSIPSWTPLPTRILLSG